MSTPRLLAPAQRELRTAMLWYEARRAGLGAEFLGAIHAVLSRVGDTPEQLALWNANPRFRRAVVGRFPYAVFFHLVEEQPVVVAVAHTSRRPGYWLDRTAKTEEVP